MAKTKTAEPSPSKKILQGKRAWRKNIDIQDVEHGIEEMRAEERVTGKTLQATKDHDLFQIDVQGDTQVRKSLTKFSPALLTSTKILSQRSAVPAVFSRPSSATSKKRKALVSHEEKARLLRIGKRPRKGPFNSVIDPTEFGAGSAMLEISEAVKKSGTYDVWTSPSEQVEIKDGLETVQPKKIKAPATKHVRDTIEMQAVIEPHQGASYNPPVEAHQELLLQAHEAEERRVRAAEKHAQVKEQMESAKAGAEDVNPGIASGMKLHHEVDEDEEEEDTENREEVPAKRQPARKTKAQRSKAARLLAEKRELADRAMRKRMLAVIPSARTLRRTNAKLMSAREEELARKRAAELSKLKRHGLTGKKLGKHKVPEGQVDVQLGEDLSESLRALKPEGNLFRDRFLSMQHRALVEPRVLVAPKKRRTKIVEYEKHAWKRFE
ncbi:hypothetical protein C0995_011085 [Termitomyces sp. Mi166|nr:hypothetical protein C0995_011085 [Termitomyces sp. Mi166\